MINGETSLKSWRDGGINRKKWAGKRDLRTLIVDPRIWQIWNF